jgi:hypothetical protein
VAVFLSIFSTNVGHLSEAVSAASIQNSSQSVKNLEWNRQLGPTAYIEN